MISYYLNFMGPISKSWYVKNNVPEGVYLYGGRIDISGIPNEPFGHEYGVEIMYESSWSLLSDWLDDLTTEKVLTKEEIFELFESECNHKIKWFELKK